MDAHANISPISFSDNTDLCLENFYLNVDKMSLEVEIERLRVQVDMYKSLAKEYKELYLTKR